MSEGLPTGWKVTELGALLTEISYGFTAKATQDEVGPKLLRITDLQNGRVNWDKVPFCVCDKISKYLLSEGDIVVARTGATTGKSYLLENMPFDAIYASYLIRLKPFNDTIGKYISRFMNSPDYWGQIQIVSKGIAQPGANASILSKLKIPIPPLQEQKRIAEKLDCLLAKVDACKARLDKVPEIIKRFRQSVLADAVSGKLTEDWREHNLKSQKNRTNITSGLKANLIPKDWQKKELSDIAEFQNDYAFKSKKFVNDSLNQVLKIANVKDGLIKMDAAPSYISDEDAKEHSRFEAKPGDILISMTGTKYRRDYGYVGMIQKAKKRLFVNQRVGRIISNSNQVIPEYLMLYLRSELFRSQFFKGETGQVNQGNVGSNTIKKIEIFLPSVEEQKEIISRAGSLFTVADKFDEKLIHANLRINNLSASILSKAFRGELVPQNPNDEPAELLLKRIRAEREALAASKKKGKRTPKKKSSPEKEANTQTDDTDGEAVPATAIQAETIQSEKKDKTAKLKQQPLAGLDRRFEKADVLQAFRKAIFHQTDIDKYALLRLVGQRLGVRRLSRQIRQELESHIRTAMRRKIIARSDDGYTSVTPTIQQYDDEDLIKVLKSVIRNGYEYERSQVVNDAATYLGFEKVSDAFTERMKTIFRTAIRRGDLYRNGNYVGKP